jgi:AcrR family transcriptional regulator
MTDVTRKPDEQLTPPPQPASLTAKQSARRQRVLSAAMDLAREGGYEAVQMRDVAARADVALGTVYRYFSSKDQLLAAVWSDWRAGLERRLHGSQPLQGCTRAERVIDFLRRATRPLERNPKLAAALITSYASADPQAAKYQAEVASWMTRIVVEALDGLPPDDVQGIREVLGHVWYAVLLAWVQGRMGAERMHELLATSCHLLLDPREENL